MGSTSSLKNKILSDVTGCLEKQSNVSKIIFISSDVNLGEIEKFIDDLRFEKNCIIESMGIKKLAFSISKYSIDEIEYILDITLPVKIIDTNIDKKISYTIDEESIQIVTVEKLEQKKIYILVKLIIILAICIIMTIKTSLVFLAFVFITPLLYLILSENRKLIGLNPGKEIYLTDGLFAFKKEDRSCIKYRKTARCCFEDCDGIIHLQAPPDKEQHRFELIGCCDKNPYTHTFTIDLDGNGYYEKMDFRPIEEKK